MSLYYIDRSTGEKKKEVVAGEGFIKLMSNTKAGNSLFELLIKKKRYVYQIKPMKRHSGLRGAISRNGVFTQINIIFQKCIISHCSSGFQ